MTVVPPRPKPPPLNALRAFEAAARLGGFSAAAQELCVTQGAIAQQIKHLEDWAGAALFVRHARGVRLSPAGKAVLPKLGEAFDALGEVTQTLRREGTASEVRIATLPSIAQLWLSPRLPAIRVALPESTVSVTAMEDAPNLVRDPYDMAIFFADANTLGTDTVSLGQDVIYPVCTPEIARRLKTPADLADCTLIHDASWKDDWGAWLASAAPGQPFNPSGNTSGPVFSLYALAVEEARNGAGILIGHDALVRPLIERGDLAAPFEMTFELPRVLALEMAPAMRGKTDVEAAVRILSE